MDGMRPKKDVDQGLDLVQNKKVLLVGIACVDFVNIVENYPIEDSVERGVTYYWQRGGNANNSATVLSLLSVPCALMAVLPSLGPEAKWMREEYASCGIDISHCADKACSCAISTCIVSETSASRTIVHYPRDHPKLSYEDFHQSFQGDFSDYSWVHFELASNVQDFASMIDDVVSYNSKMQVDHPSAYIPVVISVEVEQPEIANAESVMNKADCVFVSKDFAKSRGCHSPSDALNILYRFCKKSSILVCPWGDQGSDACCGEETVSVSALDRIKPVDTLGAGDTFISGFISKAQKLKLLSADQEKMSALQETLKFANMLAGKKCEVRGYTGLERFANDF